MRNSRTQLDEDHYIDEGINDAGGRYDYFQCKKGEFDFQRQIRATNYFDELEGFKYCPFCGVEFDEEVEI